MRLKEKFDKLRAAAIKDVRAVRNRRSFNGKLNIVYVEKMTSAPTEVLYA